MTIEEAGKGDLQALLRLYTHLHGNDMPPMDTALAALWQSILAAPGHHILLGREAGAVVSSCVLLVVPNLTHGQRPYALIENVITHPAHRGRGHASALLEHAVGLAEARHCYKVMLMTGSKEASTLAFYRRAGFNSEDKTAFVRWLP